MRMPGLTLLLALAATPLQAQEDGGSGGQKYLLTWWERSQGSATDYEEAQRRLLQLFGEWQVPESMRVHQFLVRVGEFGGYMVLETDNLHDLHQATSTFAPLRFRVEPVIEVMDAAAAEQAAIDWRDEADANR